MPEYSVLYPHISSLSASGKSNGHRFNSAIIQINIIIKPRKHGSINQLKAPNCENCANIIPVIFIVELRTATDNTTNVIGIS